MKSKILELLRQEKEHISGQQLCARFGVSRTAVWKAMNQLKEDGYEIEAVQNKGYKLLHSPDVMTEYELSSRMTTRWCGRTLQYYETTGSTNNDAKALAEKGAPHGLLVVADKQEGGKGRRGRAWESPAGTNIAMSLVCRPEFAPSKASMLTLVMGLSVAQAIQEVTGLSASIKWPNDIVVNGKKVCGILTEMSTELDYIQYLVIGTGINVNNGMHLPAEQRGETFPEEIREIAGSLFLECGHVVSRAELIERSMAHFEENYEIFCRSESLRELKEAYESHLVNLGKTVKVLDPRGTWEGTAQGIDEMGNLLVAGENGQVEAVFSGEVSVRGLYGYV